MVLRLLKNAIQSGVVKVSDFENQNLIEELIPLMTSRARISMIGKLLSLLCQRDHFKVMIAKHPQILEMLLTQITKN